MEESPLKPHITGRIDLGHILQAGLLLLSVFGGIFGMYSAVQSRISEQSLAISSVQSQVMDLSKRFQQSQEDQRQILKDLNVSLAKLGDSLIDLRILVAESIKNGKNQK